jgi:hypothetical protein
MSVIFPSVHVGEPIRCNQVSVFPLFADAPAPVEYALGADAINDGSVLVEEISEAGSVPTLSVTNKANLLVLFLEGEQLVGAKQNRILNTSILVAANSTTTIPVSCVEQGRWRFKSKQFGSSGTHSPSKLRYALKMSVTESVQKGQGHRSDQGRVWAEVAQHLRAHSVDSESSAMEDTFESYRGQLDELQKRFAYVEEACGVAVAIGKKVVCLDLFDKPSTCGKVWDRLLSGALIEAFCPSTDENHTDVADVENFIADLGTAPWQPALSAGEGQEFRSATEHGTQASALCFSERVVHGSAVAAGQN